jgi:hypothetical protein
MIRVHFAQIEIPLAAIRRYLEANESIPKIMDELVKEAQVAVLGG